MIKKDFKQQIIYDNYLKNYHKYWDKKTQKDKDLWLSFVAECKAAGCDEINYSRDLQFIGREEKYLYPIIEKYIGKFDNLGMSEVLIRSMGRKGNDEYVPFLIDQLKREDLTGTDNEIFRYKESVAVAMLNIKSKKYIDEYVELIKTTEPKRYLFFIIQLLGKFKREEDIPLIVGLLTDEDYQVRSAAVYAIGNYKGHSELVQYLQPLLDDEEFKEKRLISNVKNVIKKLNR
ncbi:MAG: HEAT repeat domain-containing protein [Clostridia bacterium]|nr:HEAT repeat domain-containing protein [Clostridia bacterium]